MDKNFFDRKKALLSVVEKAGCPPHLGLCKGLLYQYEVNSEIMISKIAANLTRPFDSAIAPLKEGHFVLPLFFIYYKLSKIM